MAFAAGFPRARFALAGTTWRARLREIKAPA